MGSYISGTKKMRWAPSRAERTMDNDVDPRQMENNSWHKVPDCRDKFSGRPYERYVWRLSLRALCLSEVIAFAGGGITEILDRCWRQSKDMYNLNLIKWDVSWKIAKWKNQEFTITLMAASSLTCTPTRVRIEDISATCTYLNSCSLQLIKVFIQILGNLYLVLTNLSIMKSIFELSMSIIVFYNYRGDQLFVKHRRSDVYYYCSD